MSTTDHEIRLVQYKAAIETINALEGRKQRVAAIYFTMTSAIIIAVVTLLKLNMSFPEPLIAFSLLLISMVWFWQIMWFRQQLREERGFLAEVEEEFPIRSIEWKMNVRRSGRSIFTVASATLADVSVPVVIGFWVATWVAVSFWFGLPGFRI